MNMQLYTIGIGDHVHAETVEQFSKNVNMLFMQFPQVTLRDSYGRVWDLCIGEVDLNQKEGIELLVQISELVFLHKSQFSATIRDWLTSIYNAVKHELMISDTVYGTTITIDAGLAKSKRRMELREVATV